MTSVPFGWTGVKLGDPVISGGRGASALFPVSKMHSGPSQDVDDFRCRPLRKGEKLIFEGDDA